MPLVLVPFIAVDGLDMLPKLERTTKGGVDDFLEVGGSVGGAFGGLSVD